MRNGDDVSYNGSDNGVQRRISRDDPLVETTVSGVGTFFQTRDASNVVQDGIFTVLTALRDALQADDGGAIANTLDGLETELERVLSAQTAMGARSDRLDQVRDRLASSQLEIQRYQSTIVDVDLTEAITELQVRQTALQATLGVSAQILPTSLMDFLF